MKGTRASVRYAKALVDLALEKNQLDKVYADMKLVSDVCRGSRDLSLLLQSPVIKADKKQTILKLTFSGKVSEITEGFIRLLAAKRRESLLEQVAEEFAGQYKTQKRILTAVITTASGLDEDLKKKVLELVQKSADAEYPGQKSGVELVEKTNPDLIGGFTLQIGDKRVDASLAKQVRKLAMSFNENPYLKDF